MAYHLLRRHEIKEGERLTWLIQGPPDRNANLELTLQLSFVEMPGPRRGVVLAKPNGMPQGLDLVPMQPEDRMIWQLGTNEGGPIVWLMGYNGVCVELEGTIIPLFSIERVTPGVDGTIYFSYLPKEYDPEEKGEVILTEDVWLESGQVETLRDMLDLL